MVIKDFQGNDVEVNLADGVEFWVWIEKEKAKDLVVEIEKDEFFGDEILVCRCGTRHFAGEVLATTSPVHTGIYFPVR